MIPRLRVREPDSIAHAAWHYDMPPGGMGRLLSLFRVRQCTVTGAVELRSAGRQRHRNYLRTASLAGGTHTATVRPSHRLMAWNSLAGDVTAAVFGSSLDEGSSTLGSGDHAPTGTLARAAPA